MTLTSLCCSRQPGARSVYGYASRYLTKIHIIRSNHAQLEAHQRFVSFVDSEFKGIHFFNQQMSSSFVVGTVFKALTLIPTFVTIMYKVVLPLMPSMQDTSATSTTLTPSTTWNVSM